MVHDAADVPGGPASLDSVKMAFDEQRLISDAGLLLSATLAERLGLEQLVDDSVWLGYRTPGAALPGRKVMSLVLADQTDAQDPAHSITFNTLANPHDSTSSRYPAARSGCGLRLPPALPDALTTAGDRWRSAHSITP